jgi:CRP-like cAMP-binding protein
MDKLTLQTAITEISALPEEELTMLMDNAVSRTLKKGEALLKEGEVCRSFYLVETGYLRTYCIKNGVPINLNFTFEGDFTSNLKSLKSKQGSEYSIVAGEDTSVWVFDLNIISKQPKLHPAITLFVRRLAIRLLLASEEHSNLFKIYTPAERYHYIEEHNPKLLQRIPLSQIASYIGIARETLSRIRAKAH